MSEFKMQRNWKVSVSSYASENHTYCAMQYISVK